ncbi:MAG: MAPEG family protein [Polyangiaceae bacterium]
MTIPFWCLAIGILLPYFWAPLSLPERKQRFGRADFHLPRVQAAALEGTGARAMGAHMNAFEALSVFGVSVVVAHLAGADPRWSAVLSVGWVVARLVHGIMYVTDRPSLRTPAFAMGMLCSVGLLGLAIAA